MIEDNFAEKLKLYISLLPYFFRAKFEDMYFFYSIFFFIRFFFNHSRSSDLIVDTIGIFLLFQLFPHSRGQGFRILSHSFVIIIVLSSLLLHVSELFQLPGIIFSFRRKHP